ncbi:MAG: 50S ribosomal protein L6 [Sulfolobales archaeon]|nr:50S ribosomal protein L6 [Sulfolobales archaeon]
MAKKAHIRYEVLIPSEVAIEVSSGVIKVKGPKGFLERDFSYAKGVLIEVKDGKVIVETYFANRRLKALTGTVAAHLRNMIEGVTEGYRYKLKIVSTHFPITVQVSEGSRAVVIKNFLGEKSDRVAKIVGDTKVRVEGDDIIVEGVDLEAVSQTAANIELATKVVDRDRRAFIDGIYIYDKGEGVEL